MTTFTNDFDAKVRELQSKLDAVYKTMSEMPHTSRYVCQPGLERRDGYVAKSPKFYVFRFGQRWPEHLVLVKFGKVKLRCGHTTASEALKTATIDVMNHGFNAFVNVRFERLIDRKTDYVVGFPALLVSKNYRGDVNLLAERCNDDFKDAVYCTICTPKLDQEFEDALEEQRTPKVYSKHDDYGYIALKRLAAEHERWAMHKALHLPHPWGGI